MGPCWIGCTAYGIADDPAADTAIINDVPGRARHVLDRLVLVDLGQDSAAGCYRWDRDTAATIPVGARLGR
ncbi:hypothetical protein L6E12_27080 [Actinokineospora sp. PR83]|uniref:hypothetical protein n=1 Tax=Actinokineospora sp. PR83 TaxID=2884908 RepID=UPI001F44FEEE|nr:hypothetical protein [Actinokineospora sp. PR83]MCG8919445.1 hypothetical protein [Actinokineospora sp. PR83]